MGCGASASPTKPDEKVNDVKESTSWAVKCQDHPGSSSTSSLKQPVGATQVNANQNHNVVVLDADDDDDEIEIIYEQAPKQQSRANPNRDDQHNLHHQMLAAANGQEPPDAAEEPKVQQPPAKPLSKEQQAEAAKLAERRKLFDNKRYERKANDDTGGYPQAGYNTNVQTNSDHRPTTDMIMGLNVSQQPRHDDINAFLPGGILDDVDDYRPAPLAKKKIKSHDDIESTGFDAADEALMKEILEDFD